MNEITLTGSISVYKTPYMSAAIARSFTNLLRSMSGNIISEGQIQLGTSDTLIPMGAVTQPHFCYFANMDSTNFLQLKTASAGAYFAKLLAGDVAIFPLLDTLTAPMGKADTAAVWMEYLICSL